MDTLIKKATQCRRKKKEAGGAAEEESDDVKEELLKPIKVMCKADDHHVRDAARYLLLDLQQQKSVTARMKCLCVCDCLFRRSHLFRTLIAEDIRVLAKSAGLLAAGVSSSSTASSSIPTNETLKDRVKLLIELWDIAFGQDYPCLRALARYFRESLKLKMPNVAERAQEYAEQQLRRADEARRLMLAKRDTILRNSRADFGEIETNVARLEECFAVIFPTFEDMLGIGQQAVISAQKPAVLDWVQDDGEVIGPVGDGDEDEGEDGDEEESIRKRRRILKETEEVEDNIQWETASDDDNADTDDLGDRKVGSRVERPSAAPCQLEVTMRSTLKSVETPDNAVVVTVMRELCKYLARHAVPLLRQWQSNLSEAVAHDMAIERTSGASSICSHSSSSSSSSSSGSSSASVASQTKVVLRQCALLVVSCLRILRKSKGIYDDEVRSLLKELGETL